jgi:hypothetical protein
VDPHTRRVFPPPWSKTFTHTFQHLRARWWKKCIASCRRQSCNNWWWYMLCDCAVVYFHCPEYGPYENGNEASVPLKDREFLGHISDYYLLIRASVAVSLCISLYWNTYILKACFRKLDPVNSRLPNRTESYEYYRSVSKYLLQNNEIVKLCSPTMFYFSALLHCNLWRIAYI